MGAKGAGCREFWHTFQKYIQKILSLKNLIFWKKNEKRNEI